MKQLVIIVGPKLSCNLNISARVRMCVRMTVCIAGLRGDFLSYFLIHVCLSGVCLQDCLT